MSIPWIFSFGHNVKHIASLPESPIYFPVFNFETECVLAKNANKSIFLIDWRRLTDYGFYWKIANGNSESKLGRTSKSVH